MLKLTVFAILLSTIALTRAQDPTDGLAGAAGNAQFQQAISGVLQ